MRLNLQASLSDLARYIWHSRGVGAAAGRALLTPLAGGYGLAVAGRNWCFDRRWLRTTEAAVPVMSVGNLTVGGTGKTPVSSFLASALLRRGARPVILTSGYGGDEALVHRALQPEVAVVAGRDRAAAAAVAVRQHGASVVLLDDGFQHRRLKRDVDIALINVDRWQERRRLLPAGPWRERLRALSRATLIGLTSKLALDAAVSDAQATLHREFPGMGVVHFRLTADRLMPVFGTADEVPAKPAGRRMVLVTGVAEPGSVAAQLRGMGLELDLVAYRDHHPFSASDVRSIIRRAEGADGVLCTLKDAVKLRLLWPREAVPLWYVSQSVEIERGGDLIYGVLDALIGVNR